MCVRLLRPKADVLYIQYNDVVTDDWRATIDSDEPERNYLYSRFSF